MTTSVPRMAVKLQNIVVTRGAFKLHINELVVRRREIVCIVGPNGCGKSTLLQTVLGLLPYQGRCWVGGIDYRGDDPVVKSTIGFIPDDPELLFEELTAREQWSVTASVLARIRPSLKYEQLVDHSDEIAAEISFNPPAQLVRGYSHGMRKKTQIVNALLGYPSVIVVDELRNGLDPIAIVQSEQLLKAERDRGAGILAATHDLWWAERFADYIYILNNGHVVASGTLKQLLRKGEQHLEQAFCRIVGVTA